MSSLDVSAAQKALDGLWSEVQADPDIAIDPEIKALSNSNLVAIRFCLPTQLLGKLIDNSLDALCLQKGDGEGGAWDPREFCKRVVVPWNRNIQSVLGTSADPYVSKPLRRPRVDQEIERTRPQSEWKRLSALLKRVEDASSSEVTHDVLRQVLGAIHARLQQLTFSYVVPQRVSLVQALALVRAFLSESSGGDRGLAVCAAFFEAVGERTGLWQDVDRGVVNASDTSAGAAGDLECVTEDGEIALAVEVKERELQEADVHTALSKARVHSVREVVLCTYGVAAKDEKVVGQIFGSAWASGTNLYDVSIDSLLSSTLPLLGEETIMSFISRIGPQLDKYNTQPRHRQAWKALLEKL